jgi:hypothetical protein
MKPRNFPARKLARKLRLVDGPTDDDIRALLTAARAVRTKIVRKARKS